MKHKYVVYILLEIQSILRPAGQKFVRPCLSIAGRQTFVPSLMFADLSR
jgi:hypothetical protein